MLTGIGHTFAEREVRLTHPRIRLEWAERVTLPYSEVCLHMGVAGETRPVLRLTRNMAWILDENGSTFSAPITRGEAGLL